MRRICFFLIFFVLAISTSAQAIEVCDAINKIVKSGLDPKRPFAAIAALQLPGAECETNIEDRNYWCGWTSDGYDIMHELEGEHERLLSQWVRARGDRAERSRLRSRMDAIDRDLSGLKKHATKSARRSYGMLYTALYECFDKGRIEGAAQYDFKQMTSRRLKQKSSRWTRRGGCKILLREGRQSEDSVEQYSVALSVRCGPDR